MNNTADKKLDDGLPETEEKSFCMTYVWHWMTFLLLSAVAVTIGVVLILILQQIQLTQFDSIYRSSCQQNFHSLDDNFNNYDVTTRIVTQIYNGALEDPLHTGSLPNITLANYEKIMKEMKLMAGFDYIAYSPLVTNTTRKQFESFAIQNVPLPSLHNRVSKGILNTTFLPAGDYNAASIYPTTYFPIWQITSINSPSSSQLLMLDPKWSYAATIDNCMVTHKPQFSDIRRSLRVVDNQPFTVLYAAMYDDTNSNNTLYGLLSAPFSWVSNMY